MNLKIFVLGNDHKLKMLTITKYLSTILENKAYLTAEKRVYATSHSNYVICSCNV